MPNVHMLPGFLRGQQSASAGIWDAVYLPDLRQLQITFKTGRSFAYNDVPQNIYNAFLASPSRCAFFNIAIRGRFQFHEMKPKKSLSLH